MTRIGVPVPDGFTVTTAACVEAMRRGGEWPEGLWQSIEERLRRLEERTGRVLGAGERPLLVSVRSGAVHSMPGMMDTILNLGITDESVVGLGAEAESPRFAWDSYRRFIQMYGEVVESVPSHVYDDALEALKSRRGVSQDTDLTADDLQELVATFKDLSREHMGEELPAEPREQLRRSDRRGLPVLAQPARRGLPPGQQHPRRPRHGRQHHADGLRQPRRHLRDRGLLHPQPVHRAPRSCTASSCVNAQGEDVVAGIRTPRPLAEMESVLPEAYKQLLDTMASLEQHYGDMQDIEFTVEQGTLYLLQTRNGKRTAQAAIRWSATWSPRASSTGDEALRRIEPGQLDQLLHPAIDPSHEHEPLTTGLNASPGAAVGSLVFDADTAEQRGRAGDAVVLVRWETTPDDIHGVIAAQGVLTAHGGMTSHAAVVARGMGKPCVAGASSIKIDAAREAA